jgi:hypothetical protein
VTGDNPSDTEYPDSAIARYLTSLSRGEADDSVPVRSPAYFFVAVFCIGTSVIGWIFLSGTIDSYVSLGLACAIILATYIGSRIHHKSTQNFLGLSLIALPLLVGVGLHFVGVAFVLVVTFVTGPLLSQSKRNHQIRVYARVSSLGDRPNHE